MKVRMFVVLWLAAAACSTAIGSNEPDPNASDVTGGLKLFEVYCVNCHGVSATGDGPTAAYLRVRPADLTRIRDDNGEFPHDRVYRTIDGRRPVMGHGARRMPIWGLSFQDPASDGNQEADVARRISQLVAYLQSIQMKRRRR